jgi:hypothetical protein
MKHIYKYSTAFFFALLFYSFPGFSQAIIDEDFVEIIGKNARPYMDEKIAAFEVKTVPEKWKNESAVIMGYRRSITFDKKVSGGWISSTKSNVFLYEKVRFKIRLQDKNALERFTEVYFRYGDKQDGFLAEVTKYGSEVQPVDVSSAVQVESKSEVPEFYKSFFDQNSGQETRYYKVAIPNLEVGDVLEYVAYTKSKLNVMSTGYVEFDPQYEICSKKYPVMFNEISIDTDNKTFFKSLSLNGAPEFKKENSDTEGFYRYVFVDKDRGTEKDVNFVSQFLISPLVKFQVIYANSDKIKSVSLIGDQGELKTGFSKEELAKVAWANYSMGRAYPINNSGATAEMLVNYIYAQLKKESKADLPADMYTEQAYYRIRNHVLFRSNYLPDNVFAYMFRTLLGMRKIESELVITTSNKLGKLKDVLFDNEIRYATKLNNKYYFNCTDHSNPDELVESLLGNEGYVIGEPAKKTNEQVITPVTLPDATVETNTSQFDIAAQFDVATGKMMVTRTSNFRGINKAREIEEKMKFTTYIIEDFKNYNGPSPLDGLSGPQIDEYYKSVAALKEEFKTAKPEQVEDVLQGEYNSTVKYKNFRVVSDGRSMKKKPLTVVEEFEIGNVTKRAGKKILLNLPGLITSQLHIAEEERNRTHDIYLGYPRRLKWNITLTVPEGYIIKGLKELNKVVDNEAGNFTCEAKEDGGKVFLTITKTYKQKQMSKDKWNAMLAFVDEAYNTAFRYILLQPK